MSAPAMYEQIAADIRTKITSGEYQPGQRLPSTSELCKIYDVSETVIRFAMVILRGEGLVYGRQGKGVYVADRQPG